MFYKEHINRNGTDTYLSTTLLSEKKNVCPNGQISLLLMFKNGLNNRVSTGLYSRYLSSILAYTYF